MLAMQRSKPAATKYAIRRNDRADSVYGGVRAPEHIHTPGTTILHMISSADRRHERQRSLCSPRRAERHVSDRASANAYCVVEIHQHRSHEARL